MDAKDVPQTRKGVVSEHSVGVAGAAQVGVTHNRAPPESGDAAVMGRDEAIRVQTRVVIKQRGAVGLP